MPVDYRQTDKLKAFLDEIDSHSDAFPAKIEITAGGRAPTAVLVCEELRTVVFIDDSDGIDGQDDWVVVQYRRADGDLDDPKQLARYINIFLDAQKTAASDRWPAEQSS